MSDQEIKAMSANSNAAIDKALTDFNYLTTNFIIDCSVAISLFLLFKCGF